MGNGFNALIPNLVQALQGKLGGAPLSGVPQVASGPAQYTTKPNPYGVSEAQWQEMNRPGEDLATSGAPAGGVQPQQPSAPATSAPTRQTASQGPANWAAIRAGIFKGESGGDPNALFGFSNRPGGQWANTKLTDMTVDEAINFSSPSGPYGQWVKAKIGRVATPMGTYQIVGTTLRGVKQGMGLTGSEKMTPELQEQMGQYIYKTQGTSAWEGYKGPADPNSVKVPVSLPAYGPTSNEMTRPSGSRSAIPTIGGTTGTQVPDGAGGFRMSEGDFNTKLASQPAGKKFKGSASAGSGKSAETSGGGAHKNTVSPDYKRYQARKNIRHLRGMSPVATIQSLANIGKGLRTQGGGR
jgi:hypothetical protein